MKRIVLSRGAHAKLSQMAQGLAECSFHNRNLGYSDWTTPTRRDLDAYCGMLLVELQCLVQVVRANKGYELRLEELVKCRLFLPKGMVYELLKIAYQEGMIRQLGTRFSAIPETVAASRR